MRRFATALLLSAVLVGVAGATAPVPKVLAVEWRAGGGQLRWVSAQTLRPLGGPSVNVAGAPVSLTAVSPDGRAAPVSPRREPARVPAGKPRPALPPARTGAARPW